MARALARRSGPLLCGLGIAGAGAAAAWSPRAARGAADQVWPAFALVAGLLLIGIVADRDGVFRRLGEVLGRAAPNGVALFCGASLAVGVVTTVLNLDTAAAFVTPVLVYCARSRDEDEAPLLVAAILVANAGSLLLPGSNLTNLIVLRSTHLGGLQFVARTWPAALGAFACTTGGLLWLERRHLAGGAPSLERTPMRGWLGTVGIAGATACVLVLPDAALPVLGLGVGLAVIEVARRRLDPGDVASRVGVPVVVGLFGLAVALGTVGRVSGFPTASLRDAGTFAAAGLGALGSVLVNNLPAASLLAARHVRSPVGLLVGLDVGPNLFFTGSLAWFVWLRAARGAGAQPRLTRAVLRGAVLAPVAMAVACGALAASGRA